MHTDYLGVPNSGSGNNTTYYYFGSTSGIPDQQQGSLSLALNITLDEVNVQLLHKTTGSWKLMDYNGRLIQSESLNASDGFSITMKGVPSGAYILQLEADGLSESRKIMWVK